ncbi:hypothetical protein [Streptomyces sp. NBRC 110028]|uniref:hypothetical protein n=1 Tax=Streptomyces sp. NBRC 110028 TaxID=1621260 RepID=UPI0006E3B5E2|nr:hypothetical protein [Streptomyces sp. NBRC 110028]
MRIHGIRNWIEQSYKQVKDELGWADFQVRTDRAIRRHQTLVNRAFSFCWETGPPPTPAHRPPRAERGHPNAPPGTHGVKRRGLETERKPPRQSPTLLSAIRGTGLAATDVRGCRIRNPVNESVQDST